VWVLEGGMVGGVRVDGSEWGWPVERGWRVSDGWRSGQVVKCADKWRDEQEMTLWWCGCVFFSAWMFFGMDVDGVTLTVWMSMV
jgi:hypothetical protein